MSNYEALISRVWDLISEFRVKSHLPHVWYDYPFKLKKIGDFKMRTQQLKIRVTE